MLCSDLLQCPWIDCLGRRVKIRQLAIREVLTLVESNLQELNALTETNDETEFHIRVNTAVINIIEAYQEVEVGSMSDEFDDEEIYIHRDVGTGNLPIPVLSNTSPTNVTQFLTHIILSLGKYETEINALTHQTSRGCLRSVGLIRN